MQRAILVAMHAHPPRKTSNSAGQQRPRALLAQGFFRTDVVALAPLLLGRWLRHGEVVMRITEVEAYRWPGDSACHARHGRTPRNAPLWGPPGRAYVYLCYGLHQMLNIVTGADGEAAAVLVRSCEPVAGLDTIRARRGGLDGPALLNGPGKVGAALAINGASNHHPLYRRGGLELLSGTPAADHVAGPRIGIDYARPVDRQAPWRFADPQSKWVSHRNKFAFD